jgi:hypothetical protein
MTTTLADAQYVDEALAALEQCKTDADVTNWDDRWCSNERYLNLSERQVKQLEDAYDKRVAWICGVGAG